MDRVSVVFHSAVFHVKDNAKFIVLPQSSECRYLYYLVKIKTFSLGHLQ